MEATTAALFTTFVAIVLIWWFAKKKGRTSLPGPTGLPIVGYLPFIVTEYPFVKLRNLSAKYGPIYNIRFGSQNVIVLSDFTLIKEALNKDAMMGRPAELLPFEFNKESVEKEIFTGFRWKEHRKFAMLMLQNLGFGKTRLEEHIREELEDFLKRMEQTAGKPIEILSLLLPSMSNNISSLLFGRRMKFDDPKRIRLDSLLREQGVLIGELVWHAFFPWLAPIIRIVSSNQKKLSKIIREIKRFVEDEIEEHEATIDPNHIRDFIDGYLLEIQKRSNGPDTTFSKPTLADFCRALFAAGTEAVGGPVEWLMLCMAAYPDAQKKVHDEIDEAIGQAFPVRSDYQRMPYTEAVIMEINRWKSAVNLNLLRSTLADTELNGYFIPKDSLIYANLWAVHNDTRIWGNDTDVFKPERFLSKDGKRVVKPEGYMPFSIGRRACLGKPLADVEVFLYFTAIMQRFNVSTPKGQVTDLDGVIGMVFMAKPQKLYFHLR